MPLFSQPSSLHKRGSIDLNRTPSPEAQEDGTHFDSSNAILNPSVQSISHNTQVYQTISDSTNRDGNKSIKNRKKSIQSEEERRSRNRQSSSNSRIRKLNRVKEA